MDLKFNFLLDCDTWELMPCPRGANMKMDFTLRL